MSGDPFKDNTFFRFCAAVGRAVDTPVTWFRESVVLKNRPEYPYYHRRYNRVPTIDQCYRTDLVCIHEAETQWRRDREVDRKIMVILRQRYDDCGKYEGPDRLNCMPLYDTFDESATEFFAKYGDLHWTHGVVQCYMKQKYRMIWERRHGEVGTGMRDQ